MKKSATVPDLERIVFFNGQRLTAGDLTVLQRTTRELRWLHNRSLHSWGIGIGFAVKGDRGDRAVTIEPGYGLDRLGREIILTEARAKPVPATGGHDTEVTYFLVAMYQGDGDQKVAQRRPGVCLPEGTVRLSEEPLIEWRRPNELTEGLELILGKVWIQNCELRRPVSPAGRRDARSMERPYIAAGETAPGDTAWGAWRVGQDTLGVRVRVDTSGARFRTTPRYVAHIAGNRYLAAAPGGPGPLLAVGFAGVVNARRDRFTLRVLLPAAGPGSEVNPPVLRDPTKGPDILRRLGWQVVWMGIEG